ncbi:MAG: BatA domain-containing protein [Vicinamibacterales bacterium]
MSFLAPLFFVWLAALAIPVLLHLIQREKKQIQYFPSLMFVRQVPYKSVQRRRIHNWLLLMVRLAALLLIVAAFARPFFGRTDAAMAPGVGARELVVMLDQSYSMGYGDRWDRARAAARDALNGLGPSDRGSVVLFSSGAEIALRADSERGKLIAAIPTSAPTAGATRYAPALKVAGSILAESSLPRREAILISDFQRGGWRGEEGSRLPRGATLTPVSVGGTADAPNVAVTSVSLARSTFSNQERVLVTAAVVNRASQPLSAGMLTLEIGGRAIQTERLDVAANGSTSVAFMPFSVTGRNMRGTVRVGADALPADNAFGFVVSPSVPLRVILVDRGGAGSLYLTRALAIGDAPRFETLARQPEALSDQDLQQANVVLLNDVPVTVALGRRLARFVEAGGGLLVATGPRATWPSEVDILPGLLAAPIDRSRGDAARVGALEFGHPVFELFRSPRSGDFSSARIYGYRNVTTAVKDAQVLARFDAGAPAFLERRVGTGRVLLWASTLDLSWGDLPLKPVFLPFVHRSVRYLASYVDPAPWLTVGQVLDPDAAVGTRSTTGGRVALTPSGKRVSIDDEGGQVLELTEQGFYEVRSQAGQRGDAGATVVASNVDPAESDLTVMDPKEIVVAAMAGDQTAGGAAGAGVPMTPEAQERSQRLWWYLLCAGIVLLGIDTLLSNRLSKA